LKDAANTHVEKSIRKLKRPSRKTALKYTLFTLLSILLILVGMIAGLFIGQTSGWDQNRGTENQLRDMTTAIE